MVDRSLQTGVVAIGRNEGERLVRCLSSLQGSGCPVVYVDSASTDDSVANAMRLGARAVRLDMDRPFTAARARAEGLKDLRGSNPDLQYVFFVDGDCEVEPGFVATAVSFLDDNLDYAAVCGRRRERSPEASRYNQLIDREWDTPVGEAAACGGDAVYRLAAYDAAGGFDPMMLAGEEPELCSRLRALDWRIMRIDAPMTVHDAAMTRFGQWWRRAIRSGMGYAQAWARTRTGGSALYHAEIRRVMFWAVALPLVAIALALLLSPPLILLWPLLTGAQFVRLAIRDGVHSAMLSITGKFAELAGILRYSQRAALRRHGSTVSYK